MKNKTLKLKIAEWTSLILGLILIFGTAILSLSNSANFITLKFFSISNIFAGVLIIASMIIKAVRR